MIVTCERCSTQFQLDDSRVPEGGVRVRCSRCKHAFPIEHPSVEKAPEPAVNGLIEKRDAEAAKGPVGPPPGLRLGGRPEDSASDGDDEESDWEFNEELPFDGDVSIDGSVAAPRTVDEPVSAAPALPESEPMAPDPMAPSGLDLADDPPEPRGLPEAAPIPTPTATAVAPAEPAAPAAPPQADDEGSLETSPDVGDAKDELESPEDWDLFDEEQGDRRAPAQAVPVPAPSETLLVSPELDVDPPDLEEDLPRWRSGLVQVGNALGWALAIGLFGFGLYGVLGPRTPAATTETGTTVVEGIELAEARGRWVENAIAGPVYVVSGQLRSAGSQSVSASALAVEILDARGRALDTPPVPLRSKHLEWEVRERSPDELANGRPVGDGSGRIPPGAGFFDAVLVPPSGAADFRIVAMEAKAADAPASPGARVEREPRSAPGGAARAASPPADAPPGVTARASDGGAAPPAAPAHDTP